MFLYNYTLAEICSVHRSSINLDHPFVPNRPTLKGQSTYISPFTAAVDLKLQGNRYQDMAIVGADVDLPLFEEGVEPMYVRVDHYVAIMMP